MTNGNHVADASKTIDHVAEVGKKVELLPCPFCGGGPSVISFKHTYSTVLVYQSMCFKCHTKPKFFGRGLTKERAIEAWNRRAGESDG